MSILFTIRSSFQNLFERARDDLCASAKVLCLYQTAPNPTLEAWVGNALNGMRENIQALWDGLNHPKMQFRLSGLFLARDYWPQSEDVVSKCLSIAFDDPETVVRGIALYTLPGFYGWIDDHNGFLKRLIWANLNAGQMKAAEQISSSSRLHVNCLIERREEWRKLIGLRLDDMLRSRSLAESLVSDSDSNIRYIALAVLTIEWKPTKTIADFSEHIAIRDPDKRLRKIALQALVFFYAGTRNNRINSLLVKMLRADSESMELRIIAYQGLYLIRGIPIDAWPVAIFNPATFRIPEDVDWSFIDENKG
jgi:hypothetical protein